MKQKYPKFFAYLITQVLLCIIVLGVAEIALRLSGVVVPSKYYVWPPNLNRVFYPDQKIAPGASIESHFNTNSDGIRSDIETPSQYTTGRILAFGGSTTEELYIDYPESWTNLVEVGLNASKQAGKNWWVGNVGKSGSTSHSNLLQAEKILPQLPPIDAIFWYVGINDTYAMLGVGYNKNRSSELERRLAFYYTPVGEHWWELLALFRLFQEGKTYLTRSTAGDVQTDQGEWIANRRLVRAAAFREGRTISTLPDISEYSQIFRRTLEDMVSLARRFDTRLIILTQPALWDAATSDHELLHAMHAGGLGPPGGWQEGKTKFYTPSVLAAALNELNSLTKLVCRETAAECVDLASVMPGNLEMFYDDVHSTAKGSKFIAETVLASILERKLLAR